jgi:hypothetical protein
LPFVSKVVNLKKTNRHNITPANSKKTLASPIELLRIGQTSAYIVLMPYWNVNPIPTAIGGTVSQI